MRAFAGLFFGGVAALVLFKLFVALALPLVGMFFVLAAFAIKIVLVAAVAYFICTRVRDRKREPAV